MQIGDYGAVAFIATSDMRILYCPVSDIKPYVIKENSYDNK